MKRGIVFILIGLIVLVGVLFSINYLFQKPCDPPDRPSSVPLSAIWAGGCDGGNWIELVDITGDRYQFKIYRDWDGELTMHADFTPTGCNSIDLTNDNWEQKVAYYAQGNASEVQLILKGTNKTCSLVVVYPAYGGNDWDTIKEKYNL